jgi:hypothetical protein
MRFRVLYCNKVVGSFEFANTRKITPPALVQVSVDDKIYMIQLIPYWIDEDGNLLGSYYGEIGSNKVELLFVIPSELIGKLPHWQDPPKKPIIQLNNELI